MNIKELADIGAAAALKALGSLNGLSVSVSPDSAYWEKEEPARQAFAEAVKKEVEKPLLERIKEMETKATPPVVDGKTWNFRIKPWTLLPPPEGQEWHRTDWTEDMLPEGWRPLLEGEVKQAGDECDYFGSWHLVKFPGEVVRNIDHCRTRRPLPAPPVPLDASDIRATDEFKEIGSDVVETANYWGCESVDLTYSAKPSYEELAANYLRRQHGSTEWKPCTKEARP